MTPQNLQSEKPTENKPYSHNRALRIRWNAPNNKWENITKSSEKFLKEHNVSRILWRKLKVIENWQAKVCVYAGWI